jgi:hypothetical protein
MPNLVGKLGVIHPYWERTASAALRIHETAIVEVLRQGAPTAAVPGQSAGGTALDRIWPATSEVLTESNAWVEVIGGPGRATDILPQFTNTTIYRVHIDLEGTGDLRAGDIVRVLSPGTDGTLSDRTLVIQQSSVGNLPIKRTLDCTSDEKNKPNGLIN